MSREVSNTALRLARLFALGTNDVPGIRAIRRAALVRILNAPGLSMGSGVRLDRSHAELGGSLALGDGVEIGATAALDSSGGLEIDDQVTISEGARIFSHDHTIEDGEIHWRDQPIKRQPVSIGRGAWVGAGAIILGSCGSIGEGAVIGAGSVVTRPVGPWEIVVGNPAKKIAMRHRNPIVRAR